MFELQYRVVTQALQTADANWRTVGKVAVQHACQLKVSPGLSCTNCGAYTAVVPIDVSISSNSVSEPRANSAPYMVGNAWVLSGVASFSAGTEVFMHAEMKVPSDWATFGGWKAAPKWNPEMQAYFGTLARPCTGKTDPTCSFTLSTDVGCSAQYECKGYVTDRNMYGIPPRRYCLKPDPNYRQTSGGFTCPQGSISCVYGGTGDGVCLIPPSPTTTTCPKF